MPKALFALLLLGSCLSASQADAVTWQGFSRWMGIGHGPGYHAGPQYRRGTHRASDVSRFQSHVGWQVENSTWYEPAVAPEPVRARQVPDSLIIDQHIE